MDNHSSVTVFIPGRAMARYFHEWRSKNYFNAPSRRAKNQKSVSEQIYAINETGTFADLTKHAGIINPRMCYRFLFVSAISYHNYAQYVSVDFIGPRVQHGTMAAPKRKVQNILHFFSKKAKVSDSEPCESTAVDRTVIQPRTDPPNVSETTSVGVCSVENASETRTINDTNSERTESGTTDPQRTKTTDAVDRGFKPSWLEKFSWLSFDKNTQLMYCKTCIKHHQKNVFVGIWSY